MGKVPKGKFIPVTYSRALFSFVYKLFGNAGLGLASYGLVVSVLVWHNLVQCFIHEFKPPHTFLVPNLRHKPCLAFE